MKVIDCEQNMEWLAARCGSLGASSIADMVVAKTRTGWGASRFNLAAKLVCERLTGTPQESYTNAAMQWGHDTEIPQARAQCMNSCATLPFSKLASSSWYPSISKSHASPDGLVGDDGLIEIKCPNTATHIETLLSEGCGRQHVKQMQWQMACCGRAWCDFVSSTRVCRPKCRCSCSAFAATTNSSLSWSARPGCSFAEIDKNDRDAFGQIPKSRGRRMTSDATGICLILPLRCGCGSNLTSRCA